MFLKKLLILGSLFYLLMACKEEPTYQVELKLSNLETQTLYAVFEAADSKRVDTLKYEEKSKKPTINFSITEPTVEYRTLTIYFENHKDWITVYLEPKKKITISGDALYPQLVQIKGTRTNDLLSDFRKEATPLLKGITELSGAIDTTTSQTTEDSKVGTTSRLANINHELNNLAENFIAKHPNEEASAILIHDYIFNPEDPLAAEALLNTLNPELNSFFIVKELRAYCDKLKSTAIGSPAPDFNVKNIYGKTYTPASFKGRYYVLAFTAAWCDMCQTEELLLDQIVKDFSKDVDIILISLDENPQEVRNQIKNDPIHWNVVTDSASQAINLLDKYNINALPRCFLMDKDGKIILNTDNGRELKQTLSDLLTTN